eukprot:g823.t1
MRNLQMIALLILVAVGGTAAAHAAPLSNENINENSNGAVRIVRMRTEYLERPLGIDVERPRFSWKLDFGNNNNYNSNENNNNRGLKARSYRIEVRELEGGEAVVWDSGVVVTNASSAMYGGKNLESGTAYLWSVTVQVHGGPSSSSSSTFTTGLFNEKDWGGAAFIGHHEKTEYNWTKGGLAPWFRSPTFSMQKKYRSALLYVATVGFCEVTVNGQKAAEEEVLSPSISYLPSRVLYRVYNVTALLRASGPNVIGLWASPGWSEYFSFADGRGTSWAQAPILRSVLKVDGAIVAATDASWWTRQSTTQRLGDWGQGGFGGDAVDLRRAIPGKVPWNDPSLDVPGTGGEWSPAKVLSIGQHVTLSADVMEHTAVVDDIIPVVRTVRVNASCVVVEFAELFTGWIEAVDLRAAPNSTIFLSVSTTKNVPEEFGMKNSVTLDASGRGFFKNRFSYHAVRFVTITTKDSSTGVDVHGPVHGLRLATTLERTGHFHCSSPLLSSIYDTTINNYRGLTVGGMTVDCQHRERRGYGGDAHTSYEFALSNFDVAAYFHKWQRDFADIQEANGNVPYTAPTVSGGGGPAWSGITITMPWELYRRTGDPGLLQKMYPTMKRLLAFYAEHTRKSDGLLWPWTTSQWDFLGDWLTPHGSESNVTSPENLLFNNAYVCYIEQLAAKTALVLGHEGDAKEYASAAEDRSVAIARAFYNAETGAYVDLLQTHIVMPLATGVVPNEKFEASMALLARAIAAKGGHLDVGLTGNYFLTKLLTEEWRNDLLFTITSKTTFPSYGFFLQQGYTTWPEQWDAQECCEDPV